MTFEEILPKLRQGADIIRDGWGGAEEYVKLVDPKEFEGQAITPYFLISVAGEGFSMFQPTVCDILAEDGLSLLTSNAHITYTIERKQILGHILH